MITMAQIIAGVDEAGRGAVLGPLVVAGVSIDSKDEASLKRMGVKDSKLLSPKRREELAKHIEKLAKDIIVLKVGPCKIDNYRREGVNLNRIETMKFAEVLNMLCPQKAYIDCPDVNTNRLKAHMQKMVGDGMELVVEHKADFNYPVVGAASIMAKVSRDQDIEEIKKKYGDVGPGYSSNPITMKWMRDWLDNNKDYPDGIVRRTWMTTRGVNGEKAQKKLHMFFSRLAGRA